jgi:hypothetical protein
MAFNASNVYFKTTNAYLSQDDWETQAGLHSQHETDEPAMLYENEFAINSITNLVLCNKYGELLIRQKIDEGEYMYYVVLFDNVECGKCNDTYLGYSHSDFSSSLEYILDKYFNDDENEYYSMVYPEYSEFDNDDHDPILTTPASTSCDEEIVYTDDCDPQLFRFTEDVSVIPTIDIHNTNYSKKYQLLVNAAGIPIQTPDGRYISRIKKGNGKHRYYLTDIFSELESDDICYKASTMFYIFKSHYVGSSSLGDVLQQYVYAPEKWL